MDPLYIFATLKNKMELIHQTKVQRRVFTVYSAFIFLDLK